VLKLIRQNSLTSLRYSVEEQGKGEVCKERVKINDRLYGWGGGIGILM